MKKKYQVFISSAYKDLKKRKRSIARWKNPALSLLLQTIQNV